MTKPKRPKTKKNTLPKLMDIYGRKAPDYARKWQAEQAKEIMQQVQEGKMGTVSEPEIDALFADLDEQSDAELHEDVLQTLQWTVDAHAKKKP
jgi:hypothetical protein